MAKTKAKIGDVFEIRDGEDRCYGQYVGDNARMGQLVRVFSRLFQARATIDELLSIQYWWLGFFMVDVHIKDGDAVVVGHCSVPKDCCKTHFKNGIRGLVTGRIKRWELWNGKTMGTKPVSELTESQKLLPLRENMYVKTIMHRVRVGWTPASECDENGPVGEILYPQPVVVPPQVDAKLPTESPPNADAKQLVELCDNDAASDFFSDVAEEGMQCVESALKGIESSKDLAKKGGLERDDASIVLAMLALFIECQGGKVPEARKCLVEDAVAKLKKPPTLTMAQRAMKLAEKIQAESELADLWDAQGQLAEWRRKVSALIARCKKVSGG